MTIPKKTLKITATILFSFFLIYKFLLSDFNPMFKSEEFVYLNNALKVNEKENLKPITDIYKKIHEKTKDKRCSCEVSTRYIGPYRHGYSLTKKIFLLKIEKEFTEEECLKFELLNTDFNYGNTGIKSASKFYFNKTVDQLNEVEKITFVAMLDNATLYNPIRNKAGVTNKVRLYQLMLHNKKL